jgi:hypothetical protein
MEWDDNSVWTATKHVLVVPRSRKICRVNDTNDTIDDVFETSSTILVLDYHQIKVRIMTLLTRRQSRCSHASVKWTEIVVVLRHDQELVHVRFSLASLTSRSMSCQTLTAPVQTRVEVVVVLFRGCSDHEVLQFLEPVFDPQLPVTVDRPTLNRHSYVIRMQEHLRYVRCCDPAQIG